MISLRFFRNIFLVLGTDILARLANVVVFVLIGRVVGVTSAGLFSLGTVYLLIFSSLVIGIDELVTRQVVRNPEKSLDYLIGFLIYRLLLGLILFGLMATTLYAINYPLQTRHILILFGLCLIPDGILRICQAFLIAFENYSAPFIAGFFTALFRIIGLIIVLKSEDVMAQIAFSWLISSFLAATFLAIMAIGSGRKMTGGKIAVKFVEKNDLYLSLPFVLISLITTLEYQADVILISILMDNHAVAIYSSITTVIFSLALIPQAFKAAIYPSMIRLHKEKPDHLVKAYHAALLLLTSLVIPIIAGIYLMSEPILNLVFGPEFLQGVISLKVISLVLFFFFLNVPSSRVLFILDKQGLMPYLWSICLTVNIGLNFILIPPLGITGTAVARVISEGIYFFAALILAARLIKYKVDFLDYLPPLISAIIMSLVVWEIRSQVFLIGIIVGILVYVIVFCIILWMVPRYRLIYKNIALSFFQH